MLKGFVIMLSVSWMAESRAFGRACAAMCVFVCHLLPGQVCGTLQTMEENIRAVTKEKRTR